MTAQLGDRALGKGDRVRLVTETAPLAVRYGTATVEERDQLGGRMWWCKVELDTGGGPDGSESLGKWILERQLALVRRAGERVVVSRRGQA
ncbi:hypothetical protein ACG83_10385 [Frankia sp. R43]|uniref:hypothetical protein n=1 Tax=Frankia sp. R43 TaxID=269536 RepID=UPI0006CA49C2|nr:hypothetical protein [Frankia sp. R43]KPM55684.1 hypothetical protein ACG83_10385 [Frankia sp. R43]